MCLHSIEKGRVMAEKRSGMFDVIKFISCLFIVFYHFNIYTETKQYFCGGKFGVELFCMISGLFFFRSFLHKENSITLWSYAKTRFLRFFPYTAISFAIIYIYIYIATLYVSKKLL